MASHSTGEKGGWKHTFQRTLYIASHVSNIIFNTIDFPIRFENDKDCYALAVAGNSRVIDSISPADIGFPKICFLLWN